MEVAFPVRDKRLKARVIREGLMVHLRDNTASWLMRPDGTYLRRKPGKRPFNSQMALMQDIAQHMQTRD